MLFIIAIGLAVAGVLLENAAFYWLAGLVAAAQVLMFVVALVGFKAVSNKIDREFRNFDGRFDSLPLRVQGRRPTRYRR